MDLRPLKYFFALIFIVSAVSPFYAKDSQQPLTITLINDNPPLSFKLPNGKPAGLYVEFWELWAKTNDIQVTLILDNFISGVEAVKNKKVDIHSGLFINASRQQWAAFSRPIHRIKSVVLYNDNFASSTRLADMKGKKVGVHEDSYQAGYIEKNYQDLPRIQCYPGQLNQVFLNLLKNASQAIDDNGTIHVKTFRENNHIKIQILDTIKCKFIILIFQLTYSEDS